MGILLIIITVAWAVMAVIPVWIEHSINARGEAEAENISAGKSFRAPASGDLLHSSSGPSTATLFDPNPDPEPQDIAHKPQTGLRHLTFTGNRRDVGRGVAVGELTIFHHSFVLKTGSTFNGNISVHGFVRIESEAYFTGNITSSGPVVVSQGSSIDGDIDCDEDIRVEAGTSVSGSLIADGDVWIYENARIGLPDKPVTLRAREVIVAPTARVHGPIWARKNGVAFPDGQAA